MNFDKLDSKKMREKIGTLYIGVSLSRESPFGLTLIAAFLIRRSIFVATTYALIDHPGLQLHFFILTSVFYLTYLNSFTIYEDSLMLRIELVNECIFLLCCY